MVDFRKLLQKQRERKRSGLTMLDCYFCGKNLVDFTALAEHVKREHPDAAKLSAYQGSSTGSGVDKPMAAKAASTNDKREFLRPADLNRKGKTTIKFEDSIRTYTGKYGAQLLIGVKVNGKPFEFGIKLNGQNHIALEKKLGRNLIAWKNASVDATVKTFDSDDGEREYIELVGAERKQRD